MRKGIWSVRSTPMDETRTKRARGGGGFDRRDEVSRADEVGVLGPLPSFHARRERRRPSAAHDGVHAGRHAGGIERGGVAEVRGDDLERVGGAEEVARLLRRTANARTEYPASRSLATTSWPTPPVAPTTSTFEPWNGKTRTRGKGRMRACATQGRRTRARERSIDGWTLGRRAASALRLWRRIPMVNASGARTSGTAEGDAAAQSRRAAGHDVNAPRAGAARRRVRREDARSERGVRRRHRCGQPKVKPNLAAGAGIGSLAIRRVLRTRSRLLRDRSSAFRVAPERDSCHGRPPKEKNRADWLPYDSASARTRVAPRTPHPRQGRSPLRDTTLVARASRRGVASVTRAITTRGVSRAPRLSLPPAPFQDARASSIARAPRVATDPLRVTRSAILTTTALG